MQREDFRTGKKYKQNPHRLPRVSRSESRDIESSWTAFCVFGKQAAEGKQVKSVSVFGEDPSEKLPLGEYQLLLSYQAPRYRSFKCLPDMVPRGTARLLCSWTSHM